MGYILPEFYEHVSKISNREMPKILIETGTFKGGLAHRYLEKLGSIDPFNKIYTFELGETISRIASKRFKLFDEHMGDMSKFNFHTDEEDLDFKKSSTYHYGTVELINSDSVIGLKNLLPNINEPCCFWLDAHAGAAKYARGPKDVPLLDELEVISNHHIKNHIIAIDDVHMLGKIQYNNKTNEQICDYSFVTEASVFESLKKINPNYKIEYYEPYGHLMLISY
jgi:hypothetical protein